MIRKISVVSFNPSVFSWNKHLGPVSPIRSVEHEMHPRRHPLSSQHPDNQDHQSEDDQVDPQSVDPQSVDPQSVDHPEISNLGDMFRLDDTIGRSDPMSPADPSENTVSQEPQGRDPIRQMSVEQWLESLRRNDRTFYNIMAMEVWSIAKSMDTLLPGFWSKFMANRQLAVQNFVTQRRTDKGTGLRLEDLGDPQGEPPANSEIKS
jgi:hypothetical protein